MSQRVLITGSAGFVGYHLSKHLKDKGFLVYCYDQHLPGNSVDFEKQYIGDINDLNQISAVIGEVNPGIVFHLAALTGPGNLSDFLNTNVIGTQVLLNSIKTNNIDPAIVITGSAAEYGMIQKEEIPIKESTPLRPITPYGLSKSAQYLLSQQYFLLHGMKIICARTFNLTGPGEPEKLVCSSFAKQIAEIKYSNHDPILETGFLDTVRDFVDIRDAVRAYSMLAEHGKPGEVYNVCSGKGILINDVLSCLLDLSGVDARIFSTNKQKNMNDVQKQVGDPSRIQNEIGWKPILSIDKSMKDLLNYWYDTVTTA